MPHLPSPHKHIPKESFALATIDLENSHKKLKSAHKESNPKKALKLTKDAKSYIHKAKKIFSNKKSKNPSLQEGVANAYHGNGELLDKLGGFKQTQECHSKAKELGYTHKGGGHTPSSQSSDKCDSSNQSISHLESLSHISSSAVRNIQVSNPKMVQSSSDTLLQETLLSKVDEAKYTESRDAGHILCNIFNKDGTIQTVKYALPKIDGRVTNAQQFVYCLGLLTATSEELEPEEQDWVLKVRENADEKGRLDKMTNNMIQAFVRNELKNYEEIEEIVWLAPYLDQQHLRKSLQILISCINDNKLLEVSMVDGLVRMIRNVRQMKFESDDLVKILDLLCSRLENTHDQSTQLIYKLTLAVSAIMDSMADNNVKGLSREQLYKPLSKYLQCLMDKPEPYLIYQAAYAFQALQYVPDDESQFQAIQRTGMTLLQGVIGVATGAKRMDIGSVIDGLRRIHGTVSEVAKPFIFNIKANIESGQNLLNSLKDGFRYKRDWYPALRAIDICLKSGRLLEAKKLVNQVPSCLDPAFQLGLCQRLGELAINPLWDVDSRQDAVDLLVEIYKNDVEWGHVDEVKIWIIHILLQLKDSNDEIISKEARVPLQDLKTNGNGKKQDLYDEYEKKPNGPHPLVVTLPPKTSRLCDQILSKQGLSATLVELKSTRLAEGREVLYISLMAKRNLNAKETDTFELRSDLQTFLKSDKK
ncbi:hypothetical protein BGZ46_001380, partial [Entomortierella lignicola]